MDKNVLGRKEIDHPVSDQGLMIWGRLTCGRGKWAGIGILKKRLEKEDKIRRKKQLLKKPSKKIF